MDRELWRRNVLNTINYIYWTTAGNVQDDRVNTKHKTPRNVLPNTIYSWNKNDVLHLWIIQYAEIALAEAARENFSFSKLMLQIVKIYRPSICRPLRQLWAIRYNMQLENILFSPSLFKCWVQYWYVVRFVFNASVIPNITYILHYNVSLSTFATVESFDKHFCKYKSNLGQVCFIFSQAIMYFCLIRFSFQNSWCPTVNI